MHDQSPTILSSISKLEEGLKTYGLLKSTREHPLIWEPVFVSGSAPSLTATAFLNELLVDFSLSDVKKQKEIDVLYHFTNYIQTTFANNLEVGSWIQYYFTTGITQGTVCTVSAWLCSWMLMSANHIHMCS